MGKQGISKAERVVNMDVRAFRFTARKLSLRETGELMRALTRAQSMKRPNREQRILLAVFTRDPETPPEDAYDATEVAS